MAENYKNNLSEASQSRDKIRRYFSRIGLSQNLDVLRGLSREERIQKQKERIEEIIKKEDDLIEKKKLQNLLNNFLASNETIGEFLQEYGKKSDEETAKKSKTRIRKALKENKQENEKAKTAKIGEAFEDEESRNIFIKAQKLLKESDDLDLSINRAHLEIVEGLPGSEEYFDDLLKEKEGIESKINNIEDENYVALRSAKLLSLHSDLEKEGHIARVESTRENISFIKKALVTGNPVFLHGPTGTGKTSLARFATKELTGKNAYIVGCNPQTKESNIFGRQSIDVENGASKTFFDLGPLAKAMKEGKVCIFDEFSSLPEEQMVTLKYILNAKIGDEVDIPGNGPVRIKQGFQIIYTANLKSDKNKTKSNLPPETKNESMLLAKKIMYQPPSEGYDIFLTRIMNEKGIAKFSRYDLENTIPNLLKAMEDIQNAYLGVSSRQFIESIGAQDSGSSKITSLKNFVLNQRSIDQILRIWRIESLENKNISFIEFLDSLLAEALSFGDTKDDESDRLLASKILVNRGLLSTVQAEKLGLTEDDLSIGSRSVERENLDKNKNLSKEITNLNIKGLAELDPFEVRRKKVNVDLGTEFVDEEGNKVKVEAEEKLEKKTITVDLDKIDKELKKLGSPARIDTDIEGGFINISLDSKDMEYLSTIDKALEKFESADTTASWISDNFKKFPWDQIKNKNLNTVIINHGETTPTQRDQMVKDMDQLGYRPATVAELTAIAIKRVDLFKKYPNPIFNSYIKHQIDSAPLTPFFSWLDERRLAAHDVSLVWDDLLRFIFVRK